MTKRFTTQCAQGDVFFTKVEALPDGLTKVKPENGKVIVAHSETGHHHVMDAETTTMYRLPEEIYECFLVVNNPTELKHLRDYDTHESILFEPGVYKVSRQREHTPQGMRRVED